MYKILIIEDDLVMAGAIKKEMEAWGNEARYVEDFAKVLEKLKISGKALFVLGDNDKNVVCSARNIPAVKTAQTSELNVYDVVNAKTLVITKDAVAKIEEVYA
mgnify:CR=1 FL=1